MPKRVSQVRPRAGPGRPRAGGVAQARRGRGHGLQPGAVPDVNAVFLKQFQSRMETVWNEALGRSINDKSIDDAVKRYCFGHDKYFLTQSMFLKLGAECGYESKIVPCEQNNYPIPVVVAKRFRFTIHHAFKPDEKYAPNPSRTRRQDSSLNNG